MSSNEQAIPLVGVIDANENDLALTRQMLAESRQAEVVGTARDIYEIPSLMGADPDVILLDVGNGTLDLPALVNQIHEFSPRCQVLLTVSPNVSVDMGRLMRLGVRGVLQKPLIPAELLPAVTDVVDAEMKRLRRIEEMAKQRATQGRAGEIITVFSPKGGVGCTTIASNLAIALANVTKAKVALVDFSLQFGDVAVVLNLHSTHGVHELMRNLDDLDNAILEDVMVSHPSGIKVLLPPPTLEQVEDVETEGLTAVLKALRKYYDYVVVDTWHSIEDATMAIMDLSNILLIVTTPEVPALRNTRRLLDLVRERPDLRGKVRVVVNRFPSKSSVSMRDIELSLGSQPVATIPSDGRMITAAINEGVSFLSQKSAVSDSLVKLANQLSQPRTARQARGGETKSEPVDARRGRNGKGRS